MRAKTIDFERGKDPKDSMEIGIGSKKYIPEVKKILENLGFTVKKWEIIQENPGVHVRWDIYSPLEGASYYEIGFIAEQAIKKRDFGYYLIGSGKKNTDFNPNPYEAINKIIKLESEDLENKLTDKKAIMVVLENEIDTVEGFLDKIKSMGKIDES